MKYYIPAISTNFICIVDKESIELAAVISSYLSKEGEYLPMFEYLTVSISKPEVEIGEIDKHTIGRIRSNEFNVRVGNCIRALKECENIILVGISKEQKSYLTFLEEGYNVLQIDTLDEVESYLGGVSIEKTSYISCRPEEILKGLHLALIKNAKLRISNNCEPLEFIERKEAEGIIIIENNFSVATVIAVNYANSVNANVTAVNRLENDEDKEIENLIESWKCDSENAYNQLREKINQRIWGINFNQYQYATFFTEGLPYSLVVNNFVKCTYVHLIFSPDLFIFNNIYSEKKPRYSSAIVFSPEDFKDEETKDVIACFNDHNYYTVQLVGKEASVYNIDMHISQYPFDFLHICSHGGEINGHTVTKKFEDREGIIHEIEYDEIISFAPNKYEEKIGVYSMHYFRKFDGLKWRSKELKQAKYSDDVFVEMHRAIKNNKHNKGISVPNKMVVGSQSIKCSDFVYLAMFNGVVASTYTAPIIFNNSCWSWIGIADFFLSGGVRGYIGTLWSINNAIASEVAKIFYSQTFEISVVEALYQASDIAKNTKDQDIYIYWGLHFSQLNKGEDVGISKKGICIHLLNSIGEWKRNLLRNPNDEVKENIQRIIKWIGRKLKTEFLYESVEVFRTNLILNEQESQVNSKQSKNSLCNCGSGKKFKRCHGRAL